MLKLKLRLHPLEEIGLSRNAIQRYKPENGVGISDLAKFVQLMVRHGSATFHPDINHNPHAEEIFRDIQRAASDVDTEEKLEAAARRYLEKPADQVEQIRQQYNDKLALIQQRQKEAEDALLSALLANVSGNELFEPPVPRIRRYCIDEPKLEAIFAGESISFKEVFYPTARNLFEYTLDSSGKVKRFKLAKSDLVVNADQIKRYNPKEPNEILLYEKEPTVLVKKGQGQEIFVHPRYLRDGKGEDLTDIKIIGSLDFNDPEFGDVNKASYLNEALSKLFGLLHDEFWDHASKTALLEGTVANPRELAASIIGELKEGFTPDRFRPLLRYLSYNVTDNAILIGCKNPNDPRIVLLGSIRKLHEKTPNLYRKS